MEELKPCPFCGKSAKRYFGNVIGCTDIVNCGAQIESSDHGENTFAFTRDSWNRRAENESLRAEVEVLKKYEDFYKAQYWSIQKELGKDVADKWIGWINNLAEQYRAALRGEGE